MIDARWIDISNGKLVNITVAHEAPSGNELQCKDGHRYSEGAIYPLSTSTLDGIKVRMPANPTIILADEYGMPSLSNKNQRGHHFDAEQNRWVLDSDWHEKMLQEDPDAGKSAVQE